MALTKGAVQDIELGRGGSYSSARDAIKHYLWDTWIIPAAVVNHTYFQQGVGSVFGAGAKAVNETNLYDSGKLPNGQTFHVKKMCINCIAVEAAAGVTPSDTAQAFVNVLQSSVFELKLQGREFDLQVHGSDFLPNLTIYGAAGANIGTFGAGVPLAGGWVSLEAYPIFLDNLVSFQVDQIIANPIAATLAVINAGATLLNGLGSLFQVMLEGSLTRAK